MVEVKPNDSPFWKGIMRVKNDFFKHVSFTLGNGQGIKFWEDPWLSVTPLSAQYPASFSIVRHKEVLISHVLTHDHLNIRFQRSLVGNRWTEWLHLVERLMDISITDDVDTYTWKLTPSGVFLVKSFYADKLNGHTRFLKTYLWKFKVPLKIKIFMWFLHRKVLLTKNNLIKRRSTGCKKCVFCDTDDSVEHLFISCPLARQIWRLIHFTFNITPPANITNLFGNWLNGVDKGTKANIRIGVCAFLWAI